MARTRVESFTISLDGYGAGPNQNLEHPLGVGGEKLHDWLVSTRRWPQLHGIHEALDQARQAAGDKDVQISGGAATIRQYLRAGLIDELHIAISPILLGSGERLFEDLERLPLGYKCVQFAGSEKAAHMVLRRL